MSWQAPIVGRLSDRFGRRPFLIAVLCLSSVAPVLLALHVTMGATLYAFFPAQALLGEGLLLSLSAAYVSDLVRPGNQATSLSLNLAGVSIAIVVGPIVSGHLSINISVWISAGGAALSVLMMFFVPESTSEAAKLKATERQRTESWLANAPWQCFSVMAKTRLFSLLAFISALSALAQWGIIAVLAQFLELELKFTKADLGLLFTVAGACGIFVQVVAIRLLQRFLGETGILIFSSLMRLLEMIAFCFGRSKGVIYLGIIFGGLAYLVNVACSSILSKNTAFHEQGNVQGSLYGIICFTGGLGPPTFALVFALFSKKSSDNPYYPGAPFLYGAAVTTAALLLTFFINRKEAEQEMEEDHSQGSDQSFSRALTTLDRTGQNGQSVTPNGESKSHQQPQDMPGNVKRPEDISTIIPILPDTPPVPPSYFQTTDTTAAEEVSRRVGEEYGVYLSMGDRHSSNAGSTVIEEAWKVPVLSAPAQALLQQFRRHPNSDIVPAGLPEMLSEEEEGAISVSENHSRTIVLPILDLLLVNRIANNASESGAAAAVSSFRQRLVHKNLLPMC